MTRGELDPSLNDAQFTIDALRESGLRLDGRTAMEWRSLNIRLPAVDGGQLGAVEVELGRTRVFARVSCEAVRPMEDRPTEGLLQFHAELMPIASPAFEAGRTSEEEVALNRMLEKTLKGSRALDTEGLCIVAGKMVWAVRVDVHVLDYDGNMLDAASIAAITALLHFRRPDTTVVGEEVTIHTLTSRNPVPLSIHHIPICCTFALLGPDGDLCIMDPTLLEEQVQSGRMTISMNNYRELCGLAKPGGVPVDMDRIAQCCELAHGKTTEIIERIQALLKEDQQRRESKVGGLMARKPREGARVPGG